VKGGINMENKKDTRWVAAVMLGLIGIVTFWSIMIPILCVFKIGEIYEKE
jgi:hypothetical protein